MFVAKEDGIIRVKINSRTQISIFKKFKKIMDNIEKVAKLLNLKEATFKRYATNRTRYLPEKTINKLCSILKINKIRILERTTLKEIRQKTIKKTYPSLKRKYGDNWQKVLAIRGHKTSRKKYGKNWRALITARGYKTSRKKYGKNFQKKIWNKAILSLENRYGPNWAKINSKKAIKKFKEKYGNKWADILMKNARKGHFKKYGKNWAKVLSNKGKRSLIRKYGENYRKELYKLANFLGKRPLTNEEKHICRILKKSKIPFGVHCTKNNREYDIAIPNLDNPKIIIESGKISSNIVNSRYKLAQLLEQKKNFPLAISIAIFKRKNKKEGFKPAVYHFLVDNDIFSFLQDDLNKVALMIKEFLLNKNKKLIEFRYPFYNYDKSVNLSFAGALSNKRQFTNSERKLSQLLKKIKADSERQVIIKTRYGNSFVVDNLERIKNIKIIYEITDTKNQNTLRALAGKIAFLKYSNKNLKFIVILSKRKELTNKYGDAAISNYADNIILKSDFNKEGLINARANLSS
ncbi:MAG TPA: hypothetical protein VJB94_02835 [Candidatus Nanoarchaeia archaeon]|nr:hypothetical protein [Candidatus Nanoarchaeia archaeon]